MALPNEPLTRTEQYLNRTATGGGTIPDEPLTRVEMYLNKIATGDGDVPEVPLTRMEQYLAEIAENGGGGVDPESITLVTLNVSQNGTTNAPTGKAYNKVVANVPNTYAASDEGKVVDNGALVSQTTETISQNGTVDTTTVSEVTVNVPNTYVAGDEGKVVSNGSLVSQTAHAEVTQNGTIDTTTNNSVTVNVPQGSTPTGTKQISITENGTTTEDVAAYANAEITVNVPSGGGDYVAADWLDPAKPTGDIIFDGTFINVNKGSYLLIGRSGIGNVHFTNSTILPASIFQNSSVARFVGEKILNIGGQAFYNSRLSEIDVQGINNYSSVFSGCNNLQTVILRGTSVTAIAANAFNSSRFSNGGSGGTIYIPKALYDHLGDGTALDYKAATNWSTLDGYGTITWAQIEGSIYETQYVDGTPIPSA